MIDLNRMPFYRLIVPTVDTVRYEYLVRRLLLQQYPVLLIGPIGTGKTIVASHVLQQLQADRYHTLTVHMSAQVIQLST
jgi:dynein heavy chain, axonemal